MLIPYNIPTTECHLYQLYYNNSIKLKIKIEALKISRKANKKHFSKTYVKLNIELLNLKSPK